MKTVQISLNSIDKVKSFVNDISKFDCDFDLISGRYVIDAKSIMGIFSLDLSKPIELSIHAEEDNNLSVIDPQYFKAHYKTRTNYVRSASEFIPTAYITPDGAWHTYATADAAGYQEFVDAWHRYLNSAENPFVDIMLVCRK